MMESEIIILQHEDMSNIKREEDIRYRGYCDFSNLEGLIMNDYISYCPKSSENKFVKYGMWPIDRFEHEINMLQQYGDKLPELPKYYDHKIIAYSYYFYGGELIFNGKGVVAFIIMENMGQSLNSIYKSLPLGPGFPSIKFLEIQINVYFPEYVVGNEFREKLFELFNKLQENRLIHTDIHSGNICIKNGKLSVIDCESLHIIKK